MLKRKGKCRLHKSHVLLTAVEYATIISVLAVILCQKLNLATIPLKLEIQWSVGGLDHDHTDIAATYCMKSSVVSCQG